jgi:hypothetical protein
MSANDRGSSLDEVAREAVRLFDDNLEPAPLPEDLAAWNSTFVSAIRAHKDQYRGSKDLKNLLRIAGELLYGKEIHWAMELVQNAEDAGAKRMAFVFEPERILVYNNGEPFGAGDVWAICSAGHRPKRNKIGFFGIGFKSVYKLTDEPHIYSGPYALRIEEKLYPTAIPVRAQSRRGAWFVLPVLRDQRSKLAAMLGHLVSAEFAQVLLTLTNLETIRIFDRTGTGLSGRFVRRSLRRSPDGVWDECEVGGSWQWAAPRLWRRFFHQTGPVPAGIEREGRSVAPGDRSLVILARPVDGDADDLHVHCFLPTAVLSQLRWLVQADFEPTANREQLRQSAWNVWLMREVGTALAVAVTTSARVLDASPWDLIPLDAEVRDVQQREAFAQALPNLRQATFVATRRGWRTPDAATWGLYPGVTDVVRDGDLRAATGRDVSYVRDEVLGPIDATESRAEQVLEALGAESVGPAEIVRLLGADDADFERIRRDGRWWVSALGLMAQYGDLDEQEALASTRCLPIRGGGRVRPSPTVDEDGYLVAFSRSDITEDLRAYLGESEVYLLETFLTRQTDGRGASRRAPRNQDSLSTIAAMLEAEPFNVAAEAGPYHVVASLVVPRLNALARKESLSSTEVGHAWRMLEYVRQKWPSYLSEYRKRRNKSASDSAIAAELGPQLFVVAQARPPVEARRLQPLTETYLSSALVGFEAMDVALEDDPNLSVIDAVHAKALRVTIRRAGGRSRTKPPPLIEFLKLLGAPLGPRVQGAAFTQLSPQDIPWVDWSNLPAGALGRVGLDSDWDSPDVARLATRWARMSTRTRQRRGAALLRAIEADWPRLSTMAGASARYFYYSWNDYGTVPSTWVGRLRQTAWLPSQAGTHEYPTSLVLDTPTNRSALGQSPEGVLKWSATVPEAVTALGVRARPTIDRVVETLSALRAAESEFTLDDTVAIARACYRTLADHVREAGSADNETQRLVVTRMRGGGRRGLIYAPPPAEVEGERWWPPHRVIQLDAMKWAGPYLGQLAGRYPGAAALWETLGIRRGLDVEMACEIIRRELSTDEPRRAHEYYGRLVSFLEDEARQDGSNPDVPAFTSLGWQPAATAWWSNRPEVLDALATSVPWWSPGVRDPSSVRRAAAFLGVREVRSAKLGGPLAERWDVGGEGALEIDQEARWELAVRTWPHLLRDERDPESWAEIDALAALVDRLRVRVVSRLRISLKFSSADSTPVHAPIEPHVALRTRDLTLVARSAPDAFAVRAAECLAQLVETDQHAAARALALLLAYAAHNPDELDQLAVRHAVSRYQHREFTFVPADYEEHGPAEPTTKQVRPRRKVSGAAVEQEPTFTPLADPLRYGLVATFVATPSGRKPEPLVGGHLKPPATNEGPGDEPETNGTRTPPKARMGYANTDIEGAARPFIEEYELVWRGTTIIPQGPNVGADYLASDGRYIEVKAFSGDAPDAVDLEPPEWRAAQHPEIGERFWVYIVEHLRDGRPPEITAVFNPVADDATSKEPTGKLRIRGWKNSKTQHFGEFGERSAALEGAPAAVDA